MASPKERGMRALGLVAAVVWLSACSGSTTSPSSVGSSGTTTDISGSWAGTFSSANNQTQSVSLVLSQNGTAVNGTWQSTTVAWNGQIAGTVGSSFTGQLSFSGTAADGTTCSGSAAMAGSISSKSMSWTSAGGVQGGPCSAPLPTGISIDVQKQ
jgi:hypothetical protein